MTKTPRQLERHLKGVANHRRLEILELLSKETDLSLDEISENTKINYQTGAEHVRRLAQARLIYKRRHGNTTLHTLTPVGKVLLNYCQNHNSFQP